MTQITKAGTSNSYPDKETTQPSQTNWDTEYTAREELMRFEGQVSTAIKNIGINNALKKKVNNKLPLAEGESFQKDYVEASEAIIKHFLPEGLGEANHFDYRGVKVYSVGGHNKDKPMTVDEKLHGA